MVKSNEFINKLESNRKYSEMLSNIFELTPDPISLTRVSDGEIIDCNQEYLDQTGYSQSEVIGHTSLELKLFSSEKRNAFVDEIKRRKTLTNYEIMVKRKDDSYIYVLYSCRFITINDQKLILSIGHDITGHKEKELLSNSLNKIYAKINSSLDYDIIMQSIVIEGAKALDAESSVVNILEGDKWIAKFMYNFPGDIAGQIRSDQESPISEYVANKRKAVAFNDAQNDPRVDINTMKLHGITSLLVAPIILYNEVMGIIAFYHHKKSVVFSESQIDFANRVASSLSQAIENADLINEIKKSEKKYHSLYSSMNEGVALHKIVYNQYGEAQDYIITDVNQAYEDLTGNKRNDVVGKKASNVYGTKIPLYIDIYSKVAEKGESNQFETYFKPFNKYFSISVTSPEKGKFFTVFEDITRRKLAEKQKQNLLENEQQLTEELKVSNEELLDKENKLIHINLELQKSEKKYRRILDNLQDAYIKADNDGNIIIASLSAATMYRFNSPGEMIGTSAKSFYKYHEDRTHVLEQLMENGKIENNEAIALRKDGTTFLASQNAQFYYDDHGQIKGTETLVRDITERRVVEEKVREHAKIFDVINDAIIIIDKSHRIISWNVRAEKLYGWKEEEVLGKNPKDVLRSKFINRGREESLNIVDSRETLTTEYIQYTKDNKELIVSEYSVPMLNHERNITSIVTVNQDITRNKHAEEALKKSEARYRTILENVQDAYFRGDMDGIILMASPSAAQMFRYNSPKEMIGTSYSSIFKNFHDKDPLLKKMNKYGKVDDFESEAIRKDGTNFWMSVNSQFVYDENGQILGVEAFIRDITERKKTEEQIEYQAYLLTQVNDAIFGVDTDFRINYWNNGAEQMFGYTQEEALGTGSVELIRPTYYPGERESKVKDLEQTGVLRTKIYAKHKNGIDIIVEQNSTRITDEQGVPAGYLVVYRDITQRERIEEEKQELLEKELKLTEVLKFTNEKLHKQGNELLRVNQKINEILESIQDDFYVLDHHWNFVHVSKQFSSRINKNPEDFVGKNIWKMFPNHIGTILEENFSAAMTNNEIRRFEVGGKYTNAWYNMNVFPSAEGITVIGTDITDRKEAEKKIETTLKELKRSNRELEQFAYITSHDLREPLRMITSFLQLLERRYKDELDQDANEFIEFAVNGAKRLDAMTNDLLQYSKITSQKREISPVNYELVLKEALINLKVPIKENDVIITHDPLPVIDGDERLKVQLFQNIIGNAIKYRCQEIPHIHIKATKEKSQYLFSISDNGIGMSSEHLKRIFTIFKRLHTHEEYEGTGIGLAIAQKIVYQQGGKIWATSKQGEGSTFYFTIPIKD